VFSEAQRVYDFKSACLLSPSDGAFEKLGILMNQSHESCSKLYDCSCKELDDLTEICRQSGAYGSRLTGAGWGGCAVSLIPKEKLNEFLNNVQKLYYSRFDQKTFANAAFPTKPSAGICILKLN
jgi:galactokinase